MGETSAVPNKTVPLSVRISETDSDFLNGLKFPGATTHSEKLRALIGEARQRRTGGHSYGDVLASLQEIEAPAERRLRDAENRTRQHSELLAQAASWLPDTMAFLMGNLPESEDDDEKAAERLRLLEDGLADRIFVFIERILRMAVTQRNPCYDKSAISRRMEPVVELTDVIRSQYHTEKGKNDG
jgi:hypothetical protein